MKVLKGFVKGVQVVGVGLGAAALTDPSLLHGVLPPSYLTPLLAASAIINAFSPALVQKVRSERDKLFSGGGSGSGSANQ
ncbi:MAG: hypothetical protein ABIN58_00820 [candidate division WOR-3 bacterium]